MPGVISIQSQVAFGHVGNSAAVPVLQMAGIAVTAVPTILLSNHPAYPTVHGRSLDPDLVRALLTGIGERGAIEASQVLVTGYMGSPDIVSVVAQFVAEARRRNPALIYLCDPVAGEVGKGLYVAPAVAEAIARQLLPQADIITPNRFELGYYGGEVDDVVKTARRIGRPWVIATAGSAPTESGALRTYAVSANETWMVETPNLVCKASGTGDVFAALLAASLAKDLPMPQAIAHAVSGTFAAIERTALADSRDLQIMAAREELLATPPRFKAVLLKA